MFLRRLYTNTFKTASPHSSIMAVYFSTQKSPVDSGIKSCSNIDESQVLSQLSELLNISLNKPSNSSDNQSKVRSADDFLTPEDKLGGVFLQKFPGKYSVHSALSSVGVELNGDVFAKVLIEGNLCGESMVHFFNWAIENQNMALDASSYNVVIKALGRRKFFTHMMGMLADMNQKGINPDSETLFIVMDCYIRSHQVSKSIKFFGELERYGLLCDEETLRVALKCLCRRLYVGTACSLFNKMRGKLQYDSAMYNVIINGWSRMGRVNEVEKLLKAMVDDGVEPDCFTYSHIIECFGRARRSNEYVKIFKYLVDQGKEQNTLVYNAMIFNCVFAGDFDGALSYYNDMLSKGIEPNVDTFVRIILYFLKTRRVADAIEMFDEMLGRGLLPAMGTLTEFIEPLCSYGPPHAALLVYKKARKAGCRISFKAYKLLLMRLSRFGKCGMLLNIWEEMQEIGYSSDTQVYEHMINGLCNNGQLETAVLVLKESLQKGYFPSKIVCSKLKNKLIDANKIEMTYKLFLELRNARINKNAQRYWRAKGWHF